MARRLDIRRKYENDASRYVTVEGLRLHYRDEGSPSAPVVVLLHGVLASLHTWDGWVQAIGKHYRVIRMDSPGFGLSDDLPPERYTPEGAADFMFLVMRKLGVPRAHLVGNSLGGFLASYYAALHPEAVDRLVLISPIAYSQPLPAMIKLVASPVVSRLAQFVTPREIVARNVRRVYGDPSKVTSETIDRYYEMLLRPANRRAMVRTLARIRDYAVNDDVSRHVRTITAPTLLMWGEKDRWVPVSLVERWKRDLPTAQVKIYPHLGHIAMEEHPELTAADAHAFLQS